MCTAIQATIHQTECYQHHYVFDVVVGPTKLVIDAQEALLDVWIHFIRAFVSDAITFTLDADDPDTFYATLEESGYLVTITAHVKPRAKTKGTDSFRPYTGEP